MRMNTEISGCVWSDGQRYARPPKAHDVHHRSLLRLRYSRDVPVGGYRPLAVGGITLRLIWHAKFLEHSTGRKSLAALSLNILRQYRHHSPLRVCSCKCFWECDRSVRVQEAHNK